MPPVSLAIDIVINFPDGRKAFVEVKERREQWETLIAQVKSIGERGVNFDKPDRGKDPLRKAKYILAGQPDFFSGYFGDSFDTYKVIFVSDGRLTLEPDVLPNAQSFVGHLPANRYPPQQVIDNRINLQKNINEFSV